jgi:tetratricopeptide (TPR) repeat protein
MSLALLLLLAASSLHFNVTDARGKKPSGVIIEAGDPDADGWRPLSVVSKNSGFELIWPYDGKAKAPDGPESIPVIVIQKGAETRKVTAALVAAALLRAQGPPDGADAEALESSADPFDKGVGLLAAGKAAEAIDPLGRALRERERQLTRIPSEIYPAAMLYGKALFAAGKFDDAAVAFIKALKQRPSDPAPRKARAEALIKAGKPEAAGSVP